MNAAAPSSDSELLDLLRTSGSMDVADMAGRLEVTPTAVRQRLGRLMAQGLIDRETIRAGRGRPRHRYWLSQKGVRMTGSNFTDLALALWQAMSSIEDPVLRREMLRRIARSLAATYGRQIEGHTTAERMRSLSELLGQRRVPFSVEPSGGLPVLTAHACPYPELAESDRSVCAMEQMLFSELLGEDVALAHCRLEGGTECQFQTS
jgi:DeoR family suf operon transcriptional repressor